MTWGTFKRLTEELGYADSGGLATALQSTSGQRLQLLKRAKEHLDVDAVYFAGDTPLVYFSCLDEIRPEDAQRIHKKVWNDARVPLLFLLGSAEVKLYDGFAEPALDARVVDQPSRLIASLRATITFLQELHPFGRIAVDAGTAWQAHARHSRFRIASRCDQNLLRNLRQTHENLSRQGLDDDVAQQLLARTILLYYLEHRAILTSSYYQHFSPDAEGLIDLLADRDAFFALCDALADKFNGDLLPLSAGERTQITGQHLHYLRSFFSGDDTQTGQQSLWPLYDFSVIPIHLISAIYETFLRGGEDLPKGVFYTPQTLVELALNEVLPWPGPDVPNLPVRHKVIDPACGSGIFLVEAYRRIVEHWRWRNPNRPLSVEVLRRLLTDNIHGIDIERRAVRIAAFSLHLAMLDYLEPKTIWKRVRFPALTTTESGRRPNLQSCNAFELPLEEEFDLVLGNPPWQRDALPEKAHEFCELRNYPIAKEAAHPFLWLARELAPSGRAAMLTPSKWLFNREQPDNLFRRAFFAKNQIETIVNLSALRKRQQLFPGSLGPATLVVFSPSRAEQPPPSILYCTPKPALTPLPSVQLLIDGAELKWIPRGLAESDDLIWKLLFWGSWRDVALVTKLRASGETLGDFVSSRKTSSWEAARGFQPYGGTKSKAKRTIIPKICPEISTLPYLAASDITRYAVNTEKMREPFSGEFSWTGPLAIYQGPHVLIKEGQAAGRFCAAFVTQSCSFQDTITGISAPTEHTALLESLTVLLNSSLASYLLFLTSGTWGVERERVKKNEVFGLPAAILQDSSIVHRLSALYRAWREETQNRDDIEREMDECVCRGFGLNALDSEMITETITEIIDFFQRGARSPSTDRPDEANFRRYVGSYMSVLRPMLGSTDSMLTATIRLGYTAPLGVVSFTIGHEQSGQTILVEKGDGDLESLLAQLDSELLERTSQSIYLRRHLKIYQDQTVHIVKPLQRRFWTVGAGLKDADETLAEAAWGLHP